MRHKAKPRTNVADVDMTPMLDIVFIMLIFFIVTTSFVQEKALDVPRPTPSQNPPPQVNKILTIEISPMDEVFIAGRQLSLATIEANVGAFHAQFPKGKVMVKSNRSASSNIVIKTLDAIRQAGVADPTLSMSKP